MATVKISALTAAGTIDGTNDYLPIVTASLGTTQRINRSTFLGVSGQPADISTAQSITNKTLGNTNTVTLKDTLFTLQDDADTTKQGRFQLSGLTTATTRTYTMPNASVTLASLTGIETFTNKTLTSPSITGGTIDNTTITVDSIAGHTSSTIVTVGGVQLNNGTIGTANAVVASSIANGAVTPAKLVAGTGTGWSWQSFTPTWTNFTIGNGVNASSYIQIGKTVIVRLQLTLGNTSAMGTNLLFTLPVTAVAGITAGAVLGSLQLRAGAAEFYGVVELNSTTQGLIITYGSAGTYVNAAAITAAIPGVWTTNDSIRGTFTYEAA